MNGVSKRIRALALALGVAASTTVAAQQPTSIHRGTPHSAAGPASAPHRAHAHNHRHSAPPVRQSGGLLGAIFGGEPSAPRGAGAARPAGVQHAGTPRAPESRVVPAAGVADGLFGRLGIGGGDDDGRRVIEPAPPSGPPDWSGVPYHDPVPASIPQTNRPLTDPRDPSNRSASRAAAAPEARVATAPSRRGAPSAIPTPPAEGTVYRRAEVAAESPSSGRMTAGTDVPNLETSTYQPLSATESSRRSSRRTVEPLDAEIVAAEPAPRMDANTSPSDVADADTSRRTRPLDPPSVREDSRSLESEDSPRVARRSVPSASSRRATTESPSTTEPSSAEPVTTPAPTAAPAAEQLAAETAPAMTSAAPALSAPATEDTEGADDASGWRPHGATVETDAVAVMEPEDDFTAIAATDATSDGQDASPTTEAAVPSGSADADIAITQLEATQPETTQPAAPQHLAVTPQESSASGNASAGDKTVVNTSPINIEAEIPGIRVVTTGPAEIPVRQSARYTIVVENRGTIEAPGAVVQMVLPRWVKVDQYETSRGEIQREDGPQGAAILWMVQGLPAAEQVTLHLDLSAQEARPFDVAIEWAVIPKTTTASIAVREPKLELIIEGPDQVVYGETQTYRVRVVNPGTGTADGVVFTLSPNSETPQSQQIGPLAPGKEAQFEVVLAARDMEDLKIHGLAVAELGLKVEQSKSIRVVAARLQATLSGPPLKYQNGEATYKLQVENAGMVASEGITASFELPAGVLYQDGIDGATQSGRRLQWRIERLEPGQSAEYTVRCQLQRTGTQELVFQCQGSAAGQARVSFTTQVDALADLVLAIDDPAAPAPVSEEVVYEIVVRNRGAKSAENVETMAHFGFDIEPVRVEGAPGRIEPGQVIFEPIAEIPAGGQVTLKVVAKAEKAGLHRFRTEVRCGDTLLVSEEATRYMELGSQRVSRHSDEAAESR